MSEKGKIKAVMAVLEQRAKCCRELLRRNKGKNPMYDEYIQGKKEGYEQAIDLLYERLDSITIELTNDV